MVSLAGKYVDIPQSIKDAAKPPTGATLAKIKGILPTCISDFIPDKNNTTFTDSFDEDQPLEFLNSKYGAIQWSVEANFADDKIFPSLPKNISEEQKDRSEKQAAHDYKYFQTHPIAVLGSTVSLSIILHNIL